MKTLLSRFFIWLGGWKVIGDVPKEVQEKCVVIAAPHTSNWDFPYAIAILHKLGLNIRFTIKDNWTRFPMNLIINPLGAIGVDRSPKKEGDKRLSLVDAMARMFDKTDKLVIVIPPEGSRSARKEWKTGFYYVALQAKVPISLAFLDYETRVAGIERVLYPSGDIEKDMKIILDFYKDKKGKHPENFLLDERYSD